MPKTHTSKHTQEHKYTSTHVPTRRHTYKYKDEKQVFELLVSISCVCLDGVSDSVCTVAAGDFPQHQGRQGTLEPLSVTSSESKSEGEKL